MAGIEKICEISGEHCGGNMYLYKHALIQIKPEFRKLFKNADNGKALLHRFHPKEERPEFLPKDFEIPKLQTIVNYCLEVKDPKLQGRVNGLYYNYVIWNHKPFGNDRTSFNTVRRKITKLLGYKPKIVHHYHETYEKCNNCTHELKWD